MAGKFSDKLTDDELAMFREAAKGSKKISQDTVTHQRKPQHRALTEPEPHSESERKKRAAANHSAPAHTGQFSDEYEPYLQENNSRYETSADTRQRLRSFKRQNYEPQLIVDLHGFDLKRAHREIDEFIAHCVAHGLHYVCVIHGKGEGILQRQVPMWLAQHSDVLAFDRAAKAWGGEGALVVLIDSEDYGEILR